MSVIVRTQGVSKVFGSNPAGALSKLAKGYDKSRILKDGNTVGVYNANLDINEGEIFVIIGLSGSGKSTLLRCLNLINRPSSGKVFYRDREVTAFDRGECIEYRRNCVSMVFQSFGLLTHKNVVENVAFPLELKKIPREERLSRAMEVLKSVGLEDYAHASVFELSGGMKQRVGLARALAADTEILLMDEPFSALDPIVRREMQGELLKLHDKVKKTIVFITHDVNEAFKLGDRIAIMKDASIVQTGTPEEILEHPASEYVEMFIEDFHRSRLLTAGSIMTDTASTIPLGRAPIVALHKMKADGVSSLFVVDGKMMLLGVLSLDNAVAAVAKKLSISDVMCRDAASIDAGADIGMVINASNRSPVPVCVTDPEGKLLGIISKSAVAAAVLSAEGLYLPETGEEGLNTFKEKKED